MSVIKKLLEASNMTLKQKVKKQYQIKEIKW